MDSSAKILALLSRWAVQVTETGDFDFAAVFGSLIHRQGGQFRPYRSDIDLLVRMSTNLANAGDRARACTRLYGPAKQLESDLAAALDRDKAGLISIVVVSKFEIEKGIHKDGKTDFYSDNLFLRLDNPVSVPTKLSTNQRDKEFHERNEAIISTIRNAQKFRNAFLRDHLDWVDQHDPLPKEICRNAAQLRYAINAFTDQSRDDVDLGLAFLEALLSTRATTESEIYEPPLRRLLTRRGGRELRTVLTAEDQLLLWELLVDRALEEILRREAEQEIKPFDKVIEAYFSAGHSWAHPATAAFASHAVQESLQSVGNYSVLGIDDALALYIAPLPAAMRMPEILYQNPEGLPTETLHNPSSQGLLEQIAPSFGDVGAYLKTRGDASGYPAFGYFECKVGIRSFIPAVDRIGQPAVLIVNPLSYWIVREFNRRMLLDPGDTALQQLRRAALDAVLRPAEQIVFPCPSALYLEMALITADAKFVIAKKKAPLSALASTHTTWTSTIEEGLVWSDTPNSTEEKLYAALMHCLNQELKLNADSIRSWKLLAFAIEHTHLNSGLLGYCETNLSSKEIEPLLKSSPDFDDCQFMDVGEALDHCFSSSSQIGNHWHPTARLRMLLAARAISGRELGV
jgi:predicted nucleotidyltransferase